MKNNETRTILQTYIAFRITLSKLCVYESKYLKCNTNDHKLTASGYMLIYIAALA